MSARALGRFVGKVIAGALTAALLGGAFYGAIHLMEWWDGEPQGYGDVALMFAGGVFCICMGDRS